MSYESIELYQHFKIKWIKKCKLTKSPLCMEREPNKAVLYNQFSGIRSCIRTATNLVLIRKYECLYISIVFLASPAYFSH